MPCSATVKIGKVIQNRHAIRITTKS